MVRAAGRIIRTGVIAVGMAAGMLLAAQSVARADGWGGWHGNGGWRGGWHDHDGWRGGWHDHDGWRGGWHDHDHWRGGWGGGGWREHEHWRGGWGGYYAPRYSYPYGYPAYPYNPYYYSYAPPVIVVP